jgi:lipid-A-disaccharide synthase
MVAALNEMRPDLVVLVDSSGFNLPFARRARRAGIATLYYVSPQVWAWRRGRIRRIARRIDRMAVIFPFEVETYAHTGIPVDFVGHPLVEPLSAIRLDPGAARERLGVDPAGTVVSLLPGSRRNELRHCLPLHLEVARRLHARDPRIRFLLPVAASIDRAEVEQGVKAAALPALLELRLVEGRTAEVICASDVVLAKPGTATLETALLDRPLVVAARGNPLSAALARRMLKIDFLAMPNLIAAAPVVPEFLQQQADPDRIAEAVLERIEGPARELQLTAFAAVRERLGEAGAARRAAAIAEEMMRERGAA